MAANQHLSYPKKPEESQENAGKPIGSEENASWAKETIEYRIGGSRPTPSPPFREQPYRAREVQSLPVSRLPPTNKIRNSWEAKVANYNLPSEVELHLDVAFQSFNKVIFILR